MQQIEFVTDRIGQVQPRAVMFDFDGTLSLIREGWASIMARLGRESLVEQSLLRGEEPDVLAFLEREMLLLSGKPSIFQMQRLADEVKGRGGVPPNSDVLLKEFHRRLFERVQYRIDELQAGTVSPSAWTVAGTHELLDALQARGLPLYLASGTDRDSVLREAKQLDVDRYFPNRIFAPTGNATAFQKSDVVGMILRDHQLSGEQLLSFGDGYSETVEVRRVGGLVVGVASQEAGVLGVNPVKRDLLIQHGADAIVSDYQTWPEWLERLLGKSSARRGL